MQILLTGRIALANGISLVAAVLMALSSVVRSRRAIFLCQCGESVVLAVSQLILGQTVGAISLLIGAARNLLIAEGRFGRRALCLFLLFAFGAFATGIFTSGETPVLFALLPLIATVELTLVGYAAKEELSVKLGLLGTLLIWAIYGFLILDFATAFSNTAVFAIDSVVVVRLIREKRRFNA